METHAASPEAIEKFASRRPFDKKALTPYTTDSLINNREKARPTGPNQTQKNKDSIVDNVRQFLAAEATFEDEAVGMAGNMLTSQDIENMDNELREKIMLGVDLDVEENEQEGQKQLDPLRQEEMIDLKDQILAE